MGQSAFSRVASGSAASWAAISINLLSQFLATPIYLSHWSVEEYGGWLAFIGLTGLLLLLDTGHQNFIQNELLRIGIIQKEHLEQAFWSALPMAVLLSLLELTITLLLVLTGGLSHMLGPIEISIVRSIGLLLIAQVVVWAVFGSFGGILARMLAVYGYYSRFAWWGAGIQGAVSLLTIIVVMSGGGLLATGLTMLAGSCAGNCLLLLDVFRIFKRESIGFQMPSLALGASNLARALVLCLKSLLDTLRQQGIRLLLAPLTGLSGLAAFVTMRTGANVALQGLGTITNPLMPELMRFLNQRDQVRTEAAFGTVWIVVVAGLSPIVVIFQFVIAPIFRIWTHGKIQFDPHLFALLSLGVLVYAAAQPAMAVTQGNNLLRPQLILSGTGGVLVVLALFLLVPRIGIVGAGWSLLAGEIITAIGYIWVGASWLANNDLKWPGKAFSRVIMSVSVAGMTMLGIASFPRLQILFLTAGQMVLVFIAWSYWRHLPSFAKHKIGTQIAKLPGGRFLVAAFV